MIGDLARFAAAARDGLTVSMTTPDGRAATVTLDPAGTRALADLLAAWRDPDDVDPYPGIFGETLAAHAEAVRRREG